MQKFLIIFGIITALLVVVALKGHNFWVMVISVAMVAIEIRLCRWWLRRDERLLKEIASGLFFEPEHIEGSTATYYFDGHYYNLMLKNDNLFLLSEAKLRKESEKQNFIDTEKEMLALQTILQPTYNNISTTSEMSSDGKRAAFAIKIPVNDKNIKGLDDIMNRFTQIIGAYTESEAINQTTN